MHCLHNPEVPLSQGFFILQYGSWARAENSSRKLLAFLSSPSGKEDRKGPGQSSMTPALSDALSGHVTQYTVVGGGGGGSHIHETILLCLAVSFIMFYRPTVDTHGYSFLLISVELNSSYIFAFVVIEIELGISQLLSKQALHPQLWLHHSWVPLYHVHLATC